MTLSRREILRYLGYKSDEASETIYEAIDRAEKIIQAAAAPRTVKMKLSCRDIKWRGNTVSRALSNCDEAVLFAATLGAAVDRALSRAARENMSDAVIMQAVATAMIEQVCDDLQAACEREYGLFARPRISPGYGDFDISEQVSITRQLDTARKIGLTLTDGMMLAPTKSVTALFGLSRDKNCAVQKCAGCVKTDCAYRRT